jgi:hypothetical protein
VNSNTKTLLFWVVLICVALLLLMVYRTGQTPKEQRITLTEFVSKINEGQVKEITESATGEVHGTYTNQTVFVTQVPPTYDPVTTLLLAKNVSVTNKPESSGGWVNMLVQASPFIVLIAFWIFMMRQMQSGGNKALSFGRGQGRASGDYRIPARAAEIPEAGRPHSQGSAADRTSGNGQDPAGASHRRGSQRAVLFHFGLGLCGDVRGRGRQPRARPVRAGQEECAVHHLHR